MSLLRSFSPPNNERPWAMLCQGLQGGGRVMLVSLITSLFPPLPLSSRARSQCAHLSAGRLVVMKSSPGAWQPPPSAQASVGDDGGTCQRTALLGLRLALGLSQECQECGHVWECKCECRRVCVCEREKEGETERQRERIREGE